jgi:hypothetical protein
LRRIFDPSRHGTQALTFRHFGPINHFDHHQIPGGGGRDHDPTRAIYYAGFTLSCWLVEYFGDEGVIEITDEHVCLVQLTRDLTLLDLRGSGAMRAGSVAAKREDCRSSTQSGMVVLLLRAKIYLWNHRRNSLL